jgi:hypothetical protein
MKTRVNPGVFVCCDAVNDRNQVDSKRITTQTRQAVMERGRDENLEKGARYKS